MKGTPRRRRIRKLRLLALGLVLLALAVVAFTFGLVTAVASELPTLDPTNRRGDVDTVIYAAPAVSGQRRVLEIVRGEESRVLVPSEEIAPIMKQAIVAIEDKRFYEHRGVDVRGIVRALWQDVSNKGAIEGGSTITQQYVKNAYARNEKTIGRKVREAALAWQLEQRWKKDRILTAYLNTIYFGNGAYGIQQAARTYFGKDAVELRLAQAALLAGLTASPSRYDPVQRPRAALARRNYVLGLLLAQDRISPADHAAARAKPLPRPEEVQLPGTRGPAPYFTNYVKTQLVSRFGAARVFGGGLEVTTTIDLDLQDRAREAVEQVLGTTTGGPTAALVAIDPRTGAVKAMFGGTNFRRSQFNLATQAERQPGSSFKPIVLAAALRRGIATSTRFDSKPVEIDAGDRVWKVSNYEGSYLGNIDLARAMVSSDNSVYAQLTTVVGPEAIVRTAHALGVQSDLPAYFSIGLGAVAVNPLDMARAFATIANDGNRVDGTLMRDRARVVERVRFRKSGRDQVNEPLQRQVVGQAEARAITGILEDVVTSGTGRRAQLPGRPAAGKTGTTDDYGDAWFVGYTPELVTAVWVGYPNELRPMLTEFGGEPVAGSTLPAILWKEFMTRALGSAPATPFEPAITIPTSIRRVIWRGGSWKLDNGYCPGTRLTAYIAGREPPETAECYPNEVSVPLVIGRSADSARTVLANVPLDASVILVPAKPRTRAGVVVKQEPRTGFLPAYERVRLYVTKAEAGLVPNLVGSSIRTARERGRALGLRLDVSYELGPSGTVLEQDVTPGVAVESGLRIRLVVGRGSTS